MRRRSIGFTGMQVSESEETSSKNPVPKSSFLSVSQSMSKFNQKDKGLSYDFRLQQLKSRIIDADFFIGMTSNNKPKPAKKRSNKLVFRDRQFGYSRPISPVLKSDHVMSVAKNKQYESSIKQLMHTRQRPPKKTNFVEDLQNSQLFLNPFRDLAKPFMDHLDIPNELIEKALGEELSSTKRIRGDLTPVDPKIR